MSCCVLVLHLLLILPKEATFVGVVIVLIVHSSELGKVDAHDFSILFIAGPDRFQIAAPALLVGVIVYDEGDIPVP